MKNLHGKEIPVDTPEERLAFYSVPIINTSDPDSDPSDLSHRILVGKDDIIKEKLIPWCKENGIKSFIDVGADWGKYSVWLHDELESERSIAFEISVKKCSNMDRWFRKLDRDIMVIQGDIASDDLPYECDFVFASDIIEHVPDYKEAWNKLLDNRKYVYTLIPKDDSWHWSQDHISVFDDIDIQLLIEMSNGLVWLEEPVYQEGLSWYALLVKGRLCDE